ncbi:hypothetical protein CDSE_0221 [Candidatus Kinetoplastibacterium desouzaii TCC079E]|uniref:Nif3-like dinuclear metal center hexameric protein n=1 Tax=Candidatus Kinetoplastidibacterium desouzai TCC079E TaxID=1208919 RepID=M1LQY5_9PROT|nr:Nif3-like dinuclear metal center hexameric protein [Candidatus Kinetoplastibacterium desouzaii]AGF46576.1 hypothetical protein CDSE_0221 [Candidatus Kinetoplastibacterium desouzaii TCC079E]
MKYVETSVLNKWLDELLQSNKFNDCCPNGLQIEGKDKIKNIVVGVTACQELIKAAIIKKADALIVHHGLFWNNTSRSISGIMKNRIKICLENDLNLFSYHLPLDIHPTLGNNIQLGKILEFDIIEESYDKNSLLMFGSYKKEIEAKELNFHISKKLNRSTLLIGNSNKLINKIAWCTGGAQNKFTEAIESGANIYITGEISEPIFHISKELDIPFICAGHHATEKYGIQALGIAIQKKFDINVEFIDINNPI